MGRISLWEHYETLSQCCKHSHTVGTIMNFSNSGISMQENERYYVCSRNEIIVIVCTGMFNVISVIEFELVSDTVLGTNLYLT